MSDILNDIFDSVIYSKEDTQDIEKNLEAEVHKLLEPYTGHFSDEDVTTIINLMYAIQLKSLRAGFRQGVKYAALLIISLLSY